MNKMDDRKKPVCFSKEYDIISSGISGKGPYIGAFVLSDGQDADMLEYMGFGRDDEVIRIPKSRTSQISNFYGNSTEIPERIYVKWDGDVCLFSEDHIPHGAKPFLDSGKIIKLPENKEPVVFTCKSPHIYGDMVVESPEKGSHVLGIVKIGEEDIIYRGHGTVRMSVQQHDNAGRPDRICVEWDGESAPEITTVEFNNMKKMGFHIMSEDELIEAGYKPMVINVYGQKRNVLADDKEENLFVNVAGTKRIFRKLKIEEILHNYRPESNENE